MRNPVLFITLTQQCQQSQAVKEMNFTLRKNVIEAKHGSEEEMKERQCKKIKANVAQRKAEGERKD